MFDGFVLGGDGMGRGYSNSGVEYIGLRGYENQSFRPSQGAANTYQKLLKNADKKTPAGFT